MKLLIALCLVVMVAATPPPQNKHSSHDARLLDYENDFTGFGSYKYGFKQSDGQEAHQIGHLDNEGQEDESLSVSGSFTWVGPDGVTYIVHYTADKEGYKPEIEQGPGGAVPPEVLRTLLGAG